MVDTDTGSLDLAYYAYQNTISIVQKRGKIPTEATDIEELMAAAVELAREMEAVERMTPKEREWRA